jgi:hypothetical protein
MVINIMIDTYERHRFARSVSRSRSKVKVICVLVAQLKKSYKKPCSIIVDGTWHKIEKMEASFSKVKVKPKREGQGHKQHSLAGHIY